MKGGVTGRRGLDQEQLWESLPAVLSAIGRVDRVELKAIVDGDLETAMSVLGTKVGRPRMRRVYYFDTPDLELHRRGVIVRARVTDIRGEDVAVKVRHPAPERLRCPNGLAVELHALPLETAWSASRRRRLRSGTIERALVRHRPVRHLLGKRQRALLASLAGEEIDVDNLLVLGPVQVVRLRSGSAKERIGVEGWVLPDGSRIVEVSAKCHPARSCSAAARFRDLIRAHGIDLAGQQSTKTRISLERLVCADRSRAVDVEPSSTTMSLGGSSSPVTWR